jgi:hypothetical protein
LVGNIPAKTTEFSEQKFAVSKVALDRIFDDDLPALRQAMD